MSKDKKNKATKKRRKWLDILRWVLIVVLLVVGLALIFNKSIRNTVIAWNTNKYQVSRFLKRLLRKTRKLRLALTLIPLNQLVQSLSCRHRWMLKSFLSLVVLLFQK